MAFTYFLRDMQTLERVVEHVVPYTSGRNRVQVWDAGCAMGQEPYSLAMLFAENMGHFASLIPIGDGFSLIVCKNVLLHFHYAERVEVIGMFHSSLAPGGFFATEQTQKMPGETAHLFEQISGDTQLFRKVADR